MWDEPRRIIWTLEDPPPEELAALDPEPEYLVHYAGGVTSRGAERVEVTLASGQTISSVRLYPLGHGVFWPVSLRAALEELARGLPGAEPHGSAAAS